MREPRRWQQIEYSLIFHSCCFLLVSSKNSKSSSWSCLWCIRHAFLSLVEKSHSAHWYAPHSRERKKQTEIFRFIPNILSRSKIDRCMFTRSEDERIQKSYRNVQEDLLSENLHNALVNILTILLGRWSGKECDWRYWWLLEVDADRELNDLKHRVYCQKTDLGSLRKWYVDIFLLHGNLFPQFSEFLNLSQSMCSVTWRHSSNRGPTSTKK